jgi:hypothetical protein
MTKMLDRVGSLTGLLAGIHEITTYALKFCQEMNKEMHELITPKATTYQYGCDIFIQEWVPKITDSITSIIQEQLSSSGSVGGILNRKARDYIKQVSSNNLLDSKSLGELFTKRL